jgi:hypothetical protein
VPSGRTRHIASRSIGFDCEPGRDRAGLGGDEIPAESVEQVGGGDAAIDPMNRVDAQLILDQLGDVGHRQLCRRVGASRRCAYLVAVGAADRVAVVAVGDQHRMCRDRGRYLGDPLGVGDPLDAMDDAVLVDAATDRFAGRLEERREPGAERKAPYR